MRKILIILSIIIFGNCETANNLREVPISSDLQLIRKEFKLSEKIKNIEIKRNLVTGGTYGRKGLRIYAKFKFTKIQLNQYINENKYWIPLPLPDKIFKFNENPVELPQTIKEGYYYCTVWFYNIDFNKSKTCRCIDESVKLKYEKTVDNFDNYRAGMIDKQKMELYIVYKNYY